MPIFGICFILCIFEPVGTVGEFGFEVFLLLARNVCQWVSRLEFRHVYDLHSILGHVNPLEIVVSQFFAIVYIDFASLKRRTDCLKYRIYGVHWLNNNDV